MPGVPWKVLHRWAKNIYHVESRYNAAPRMFTYIIESLDKQKTYDEVDIDEYLNYIENSLCIKRQSPICLEVVEDMRKKLHKLFSEYETRRKARERVTIKKGKQKVYYCPICGKRTYGPEELGLDEYVSCSTCGTILAVGTRKLLERLTRRGETISPHVIIQYPRV
ncbi:MAG: hypothetical protein ACTSUO_00870 [Candidatus Thorarchaeota archaeon]